MVSEAPGLVTRQAFKGTLAAVRSVAITLVPSECSLGCGIMMVKRITRDMITRRGVDYAIEIR